MGVLRFQTYPYLTLFVIYPMITTLYIYIFPLYRHDIPCRSISHSPFGLVKSSSTQLIILLVNTVNPAKNCIPIEWLGEYTWENWFLEIFNITILLNTWGTILGNSWINITENKLSITYPNFFGYQFSVIKSVVYPKNKSNIYVGVSG